MFCCQTCKLVQQCQWQGQSRCQQLCLVACQRCLSSQQPVRLVRQRHLLQRLDAVKPTHRLKSSSELLTSRRACKYSKRQNSRFLPHRRTSKQPTVNKQFWKHMPGNCSIPSASSSVVAALDSLLAAAFSRAVTAGVLGRGDALSILWFGFVLPTMARLCGVYMLPPSSPKQPKHI